MFPAGTLVVHPGLPDIGILPVIEHCYTGDNKEVLKLGSDARHPAKMYKDHPIIRMFREALPEEIQKVKRKHREKLVGPGEPIVLPDTTSLDIYLSAVPVFIRIEANKKFSEQADNWYRDITGESLYDQFGAPIEGYNTKVSENTYGIIYRIRFPEPPPTVERPKILVRGGSHRGELVEWVKLRDGRIEFASMDYVEHLLKLGFKLGLNKPKR
jgi:hypothetical protein